MKVEGPTDVPPYEPWRAKPDYSKSLNNVCDYIRLFNHIGRIIEGVGVGEAGLEDPTKERGFVPHLPTYLKLLLVVSYARNASLKIGRGHFEKLYYLDVLSAAGLTYPEGGEQPIPGSCFLVPLAYHDFKAPGNPPAYSFDKFWTFDQDTAALLRLGARHGLLGKRAGLILPPLETVEGDANHTVPRIVQQIAAEKSSSGSSGRFHALTLGFVDNAGLDVSLSTIRAVQTTIRADLIVHLPVRAIWRSIQLFRAKEQDPKKLDEFFGDRRAWNRISNPEEIPSAYHACVQGVTEGELQKFDPVYIRSTNQEFALCIFARRTGGMRPNQTGWVASIRKLADACNDVSPTVLSSVLKVVTKGQQTLGEAGRPRGR